MLIVVKHVYLLIVVNVHASNSSNSSMLHLHVHPLIVVNAHASNSSNCTLHAIRHPVEYCLVVNVEYVFMLFRYVT